MTRFNEKAYIEQEKQRYLSRLCRFCDEYVEYDDLRVPLGMRPIHYPCFVRRIVGSVGHQLKRCSCYGGTEDDPPNLSKKEAAEAAALICNQTKFKNELN